MAPLFVPEGFNAWSREKQIEHYLSFGIKLHPCRAYDDQSVPPKARAKAPIWPFEKRLAATPGEVIDHFRRHPEHNVGFVTTPEGSGLDLDLKDLQDKKPLAAFEALFPNLFKRPHVFSTRGPHFHICFRDVPPDQHKIRVLGYLPGLDLELIVGTANPAEANIIVPPSITAAGVGLLWTGVGEIYSPPFAAALRRFGVSNNGTTQEQQRAQPRDEDWKRAFRGDLRSLEIVKLLEHFDLYGEEREAEDGTKHTIKCPWIDGHNEGQGNQAWTSADSSTVIFKTPGYIPCFNCQHNHCKGRSIQDVLSWCEEQEPGVVDRYCSRTYSPPIGREQEPEEDSATEENLSRDPWPPADADAVEFKQALYYPHNSILEPFMEYGRRYTEADDIYLLGSILAVCSALVARRVHIEFDGPLYLNLFNLIVGKPGDRKSSTIKLAARIARLLLDPKRFLSSVVSLEGLFTEYCEDDEGTPDKILIVDDAAGILSTWLRSNYGERVANQMLSLYDCQGLAETFRRGEKKRIQVKRSIAETSTSLLFGATFADALFPEQKAQQGLARRFLYYIATDPERLIYWPTQENLLPLSNRFKPLLSLGGVLELNQKARRLWDSFQDDNRSRRLTVPANRPDQAHAQATEPTHVLKIAALFELCVAATAGQKTPSKIGPEALDLAIAHVSENLRASGCLFRRAHQIEAQQKGEEILAKIRIEFPKSKNYPDTIFVSRTDLTYTFCNQTSRRGTITTDELYLQIIPELIRQKQAQLALKKGRREVYAFRATDDDGTDRPLGEAAPNSTNSTNSTPYLDTASSYTYVQTCLKEKEYRVARIPVEIVELVEDPPLEGTSTLDLLGATSLALDLETYGEPRIAKRGKPPKITSGPDALNPFRGKIRLLTIADGKGNIRSLDLSEPGHLVTTNPFLFRIGYLPGTV